MEFHANAPIHGAASEVTVRVSADSDSADVVVEVADNGSGVSEGAPGLGSAVPTEATGVDWSIAPTPTGGRRGARPDHGLTRATVGIVERGMREALAAFIQYEREDGREVPAPRNRAGYVTAG